jgi:poly-beta-hydroxyalkanoate depolymerase
MHPPPSLWTVKFMSFVGPKTPLCMTLLPGPLKAVKNPFTTVDPLNWIAVTVPGKHKLFGSDDLTARSEKAH